MADEKEKKVTETKTAAKKTTKTESKTTAKKVAKETKTSTKTVKAEKAPAKAEVKDEKAVKAVEKENVSEELVAEATAKYVRISSRKVAIVANLIRGKNVDEAMAILQFTPKAGTEVLTKLLKSAIANEIYSNQGPTLKRIRPAAKGSAVRIRKRTSNTTIVLKERA